MDRILRFKHPSSAIIGTHAGARSANPPVQTGTGGYNEIDPYMSQGPQNHEQLRTVFASIFAAHPANIALLDLNATILAVNSSWSRFAQENGLRAGYEFTGANYLAACEPGATAGDDYAQKAYVGLLGVLRAGIPKFTLVYPCHSPTEQRWYRMWVQPQNPEAPAIVVAHSFIGPTAPTADASDDQTGGDNATPFELHAGSAFDLRLLR
jgi:hypothetical protein